MCHKEPDEMTAQGEEVLEGFLIGKDVIPSDWKLKSVRINVEIQCRFSRVRAISLIAKGLSSPSM